MSNLLPIPTEREVNRIYRARLLIAASLLLMSMGLVAVIILIPSYLIVERDRSTLKANIASLSASSTNSSDRTLIMHIQSRISELGPLVSGTSTPGDLIRTALALRPAGVVVDHISYNTGQTGTILLSGSSQTGDQVSVYQRALATSNSFAGVSVPVGALAGVNDGRFNITIIAK